MALQGSHAVEYNVTNNAATNPEDSGSQMKLDSNTISKYSYPPRTSYGRSSRRAPRQIKKNVSRVSLFIDTMDGVTYADNGETHISADYIQDPTPEGLIEGIADFVRLKAGYVPSHWVQPGQGDQLDQGYDKARFLDYCESLRSGFVAELNKKTRCSYNSDNYFVELLDKTVDPIWSDYKAKYQTN
ncbi:plant basic secretory protein (BSP) family protein [Actinidia rufa]|uniref:Plant basic secretory protein (BSP) family protein n=1 Tax=Actinidia rufa TaxID=165716 RepID=A0A7J0ESV2_9ERIC|nr:plant basic secretory protein (BSP) family protein [Actinidia rufa]